MERTVSKIMNNVFLRGCEHKRKFCVKMANFEKFANIICVRKVKTKLALSLTLAVFGNVIFLVPYKITKHHENWGSAGTRENPKWQFWSQRCYFGKGPRNGAYL